MKIMLPGGDVGGTIKDLQAVRGHCLRKGFLPLILLAYYMLIFFALQIWRLKMKESGLLPGEERGPNSFDDLILR